MGAFPENYPQKQNKFLMHSSERYGRIQKV